MPPGRFEIGEYDTRFHDPRNCNSSKADGIEGVELFSVATVVCPVKNRYVIPTSVIKSSIRTVSLRFGAHHESVED
jgi:hypothetical protein